MFLGKFALSQLRREFLGTYVRNRPSPVKIVQTTFKHLICIYQRLATWVLPYSNFKAHRPRTNDSTSLIICVYFSSFLLLLQFSYVCFSSPYFLATAPEGTNTMQLTAVPIYPAIVTLPVANEFVEPMMLRPLRLRSKAMLCGILLQNANERCRRMN